ncbi:MAG: type III-A CRISPR-associated protein Cas10/Csm1 [Candidatus Verstraetearchaeota archaeon]|nr:type III-A CRISPR-associated protein Cas10/Csm1 [Candidatus Verstraetearchaeota archaeon]
MNEAEKITIAALLHDIGKFRQRALDPSFSHTHQWHSKEFILELAREESREEIKRDLEEIARISYSHHDKSHDTPAVKSLIYADWITSAEREEGRYSEKRPVAEQPMLSIFSMITKEKHPNEKYYDYSPFGLNRSLKPVEGRKARVELRPEWEEFSREAKRIKKDDFHCFLFSLLHLLKKYTFFIPSATYGGEEKTIVPDVSLFYHLSTTAAFANCIYRFETGGGIGDDYFILIFGDISGLQDFIYTISSKKALKSLKGRSVYLELLNRAAAYKILNALELPITNLISCSPGSFIILAPNLQEIEVALKKSRREINTWLMEEFNGDIYISIDWVSFDKARAKEIVNVIGEAKEKVDDNKRRKFFEILDEIDYEKFFILMDPRKKEVCEVCKRDYEPKDIVTDEEGIKKCKTCSKFEDLAFWLRNTDCIIEIPGFKEEFMKEKRLELKETGVKVLDTYFFFKPKQMDLKSILPTFAPESKVYVYKINSTDFEPNFEIETGGAKVGYGFDFFATYAPEKEKGIGIKDFDELADESEGAKRIGVLRMDVDYLGEIFSQRVNNWHGWASWDLKCKNCGKIIEGISCKKCDNCGEEREIKWVSKEKAWICKCGHKIPVTQRCDCGGELEPISKMTPARYSTLSSLMNVFFHACVDKVCSDGGFFNPQYLGKGDLYLIYSGGDDLFLVGSWNKVYEAALKIKEEFDIFVGENRDITISASLLDVHKKIPVHRFAEVAKYELDEKAKKRKKIENGEEKVIKDAISIFRKEKSWGSFRDYYELKNSLYDSIEDGKISRGFLHFLYVIDEEAQRGDISRVRALALYHFSRFEEQGMRVKGLEKEIFTCIKNDLYIPVRWAEMLTRREEVS